MIENIGVIAGLIFLCFSIITAREVYKIYSKRGKNIYLVFVMSAIVFVISFVSLLWAGYLILIAILGTGLLRN